ncbi:hypothetical protein [Maribacter polysiphoniae]|nr:hypothetical protein [Maribacter polysiphoniae]
MRPAKGTVDISLYLFNKRKAISEKNIEPTRTMINVIVGNPKANA